MILVTRPQAFYLVPFLLMIFRILRIKTTDKINNALHRIFKTEWSSFISIPGCFYFNFCLLFGFFWCFIVKMVAGSFIYID